MTKVDEIKQPVAAMFDHFLRQFGQAFQSDIRTVQAAIRSVRQSSGKHIRPLLLLLTAEACGGANTTAAESAVLLEMLHTASLIHDDVIDDTRQRRGLPSLNAIHGNHQAVLVGDFIFAEALSRAVQTGGGQLVSIMSNLTRQMAEGEIKQFENIDERILHEEDYLIALEKKTAMLLAACTEVGAITANADNATRRLCSNFGRLLGLCFQIRDDLFDYFDSSETGKPSGNDLREGKVTLPLIYALRTAPDSERAEYVDLLSRATITAPDIARLIAFAKAHGGIEYATQRMQEYRAEAGHLIASLPDTPARHSLLQLADYVIDRTK